MELQRKPGVFRNVNPDQYNDFIDLVKSFIVVQVFYNTVL